MDISLFSLTIAKNRNPKKDKGPRRGTAKGSGSAFVPPLPFGTNEAPLPLELGAILDISPFFSETRGYVGTSLEDRHLEVCDILLDLPGTA